MGEGKREAVRQEEGLSTYGNKAFSQKVFTEFFLSQITTFLRTGPTPSGILNFSAAS